MLMLSMYFSVKTSSFFISNVSILHFRLNPTKAAMAFGLEDKNKVPIIKLVEKGSNAEVI